jgi:hypothetical protein
MRRRLKSSRLPLLRNETAEKEGSMDLLERTRAIILRPRETWAMVKGEQTTVKELFTSYAAILALIPPLAQFVGFSLVERRMPMQGGLAMALFVYGFSLLGVYLMAYVANWLAPKFNSQRNMTSAMKAIVFSCTPMWIVSILTPIPGLSVLVIVGALYSLYLLYHGLPAMMDTPPGKRIGYIAAVLVVSIVAMFTFPYGIFVMGLAVLLRSQSRTFFGLGFKIAVTVGLLGFVAWIVLVIYTLSSGGPDAGQGAGILFFMFLIVWCAAVTILFVLIPAATRLVRWLIARAREGSGFTP